jgi:hypothetical protein
MNTRIRVKSVGVCLPLEVEFDRSQREDFRYFGCSHPRAIVKETNTIEERRIAEGLIKPASGVPGPSPYRFIGLLPKSSPVKSIHFSDMHRLPYS